MIHRALVCLMLATLAWGQASSSSPAAPEKPAAPAKPTALAATEAKAPEAAKVSPDAPVITIPGLCEQPPVDKTKAADCKTIITRAEFERLADAVAPGTAAAARRQLATSYASALVMAQEAHKKGLDQGPRFEELMQAMRLRVLAQELARSLQEKAAQVSDQDIAEYYLKNRVLYEEANVDRLIIPRSKQLEPPKEKLSDEESKKRQQEAENAMKSEADALRARAAAGEDFAKLEEEAYAAAGIKGKAPSSSMGKVRRTGLPADQAAVFDLKPGEVSPVFANMSGYYVYKAGEKDVVPLEKVREEITGTLRNQRMQDSVQALQQLATPVLEDNYFGAVPATAPPGRIVPPGGVKPPAKAPAAGPK